MLAKPWIMVSWRRNAAGTPAALSAAAYASPSSRSGSKPAVDDVGGRQSGEIRQRRIGARVRVRRRVGLLKNQVMSSSTRKNPSLKSSIERVGSSWVFG